MVKGRDVSARFAVITTFTYCCWISERMMYALFAGVTTIAVILVYSTLWVAEWLQKEPVIPYEIASPARPEETTILEKPSIKVGIW